jgi:6-phosphogluconolactonase
MRNHRLNVWSACATALALLGGSLDDQFAYVTNIRTGGRPGAVSGYTIEPTTGTLTPVAGSPLPTGFNPFSMAVNPSGKFAYLANPAYNNVSGYTINPATGALTKISGSVSVIDATANPPKVVATVGVGSIPVHVTISPDGAHAFVTNAGSNSVSVIEASTNAVSATVR